MSAPEIVVADLPALRELLVSELLARADLKAKQHKGAVKFCCPLSGHDDTTPSAMLGEYAWTCKGCSGQGTGRMVDLAAVLGLNVRLAGSRGYTVDDYALEKGLPVHRLEGWGLVSEPGRFGSPVVYIPYFDADGGLMRRRLRLPKREGKKNQYWEGEGGGVPGLYGLWLLSRVAPDTPVVLVEGESDCHALWSVGILALGLPGADTWSHCRKALPLLQGRTVYVWEEPGAGGAVVVRSIAADLPDARLIRGDEAGAKDPCALRQKVCGCDDAAFKARMLALMGAAEKIGTPKPPFAFDLIVGSVLERMAEDRTAPLDVVPTPFPKLNAACGGRGGEEGQAHGWYVVIGGGQGGRKTMLANNMDAVAFVSGERVGLVSMEMSQEENVSRLLPIIAGVPASELGYGKWFNRDTWERAQERMAVLMEQTGGGIYVNRELLRTVDDVVDSIRYLHEYNGCRDFTVDYMQLVWVLSGGVVKKVAEQAIEVSQQLSRLAKELRVRIKGLSQLTNEAAKQNERPPVMQDLYGGMPMAADPDQIIIPDHTRTRPVMASINVHGNGKPYSTGDIDGVLVLAKNRHGPPAEIPFRFERTTLRMVQRELQEGETW